MSERCHPALSPEWRGKQTGITEGAKTERAAIVAWLHRHGAHNYAERIERAEHLPVPTGGNDGSP